MKGSAYEGVTLRHLVTMTSGVKWNEDYTDPKSDVAVSSNWAGEPGIEPLVSYMRRLPREAPPGAHWSYKTGETDLSRHPPRPRRPGADLSISVGQDLAARGHGERRGLDA